MITYTGMETVGPGPHGLNGTPFLFTPINKSVSEIKEIILDVRLPKRKNRQVMFRCGGRARLTALENSPLRHCSDPPTLQTPEGWHQGQICRRLHERGLYARRTAICVPFTSSHRRERLQWARQHVHWTHGQWMWLLSLLMSPGL
ncbi:hypothetical protein TNCV_3576711 [Trichonephila clavipes]|uniref:Transposase Tc1-like domain-containing protein n=1 Tax=Trichonephila clavipes TaxID=2585209 RepID=A0A8X6RB45_TRICX|nr:hypothetical protein TNCV_3576711 [Trichonephila clavipes]